MVRRLFLNLSILLVLSACALIGGGSAPEIPRAKGYQINVPPTWKAQSAEGESDTAYSTSSGSVATLTSSCTGNVKHNQEVLTKQLLIGAKKVKYREKSKWIVDGQEGLFSNVQASLDNKPFNLLIFVLPKNNCVFDFTLMSPNVFPKEEQEEFSSFVKSFTYGTN